MNHQHFLTFTEKSQTELMITIIFIIQRIFTRIIRMQFILTSSLFLILILASYGQSNITG